MKRKGFTLIELLGVIIILGILSMITFPIILNQIKNAKQGIKESTKTLIIDAAKDYYEDNTNNYETIEGMTYCIDTKTLIDNNYLNKKLKDEKLNDIDTTQKVKMTYHNDKFNYEVVDSCTYYTVTFDANGGSVDIDSKEVIENSVYGKLPTPTRTGYTFMGWNGRNYYNVEDSNLIANGVTKDDEDWITIKTIATQKYYNYYTNNLNVLPNTTYSSFLEIKQIENLTGYFFIASGYQSGYGVHCQFLGLAINNSILSSNRRTIKSSLVTDTDFGTANAGLRTFYDNNNNKDNELITFRISVLDKTDSITESNFEYEPYYITPETKVVQEQNHTLKAIWKAN